MMKIAIFGDIHGHWCAFRDTVARIHEKTPLDLVLQCGDAQPFRDEEDLEYMACPEKYRELGDFWFVHQGGERFPVRTLLIGGNHDPWNVFDQNPLGCELAPNIEFMGRVGMRRIDGLKIVGVSGVYSEKYFGEPHMGWPYPRNLKKQATYYNSADIKKAMSFGQPDILLLHEWPHLMSKARDDSWPSNWNNVGSEELSVLIESLSPRWCFCGHMHKYAEHKFRRTSIICLSDFHRDPENSYVILDTEKHTYSRPRSNSSMTLAS